MHELNISFLSFGILDDNSEKISNLIFSSISTNNLSTELFEK